MHCVNDSSNSFTTKVTSTDCNGTNASQIYLVKRLKNWAKF